MGIKYKTCIKCGSKDTADIIYGYPSSNLEPLLDAKKIVLGGCVLELGSESFPLLDAKGRVIGEYTVEIGQPEYFCHTCEYKWNKEQAIYYAYSQIERMRVSVGSFFKGYNQVEIDLVACTITWRLGYQDEVQKKEWDSQQIVNFIKQLKELCLLNWKAKYKDQTISDGVQWDLEISYSTKTIKKCGYNQFPKEWEQFFQLIKEITTDEF